MGKKNTVMKYMVEEYSCNCYKQKTIYKKSLFFYKCNS